MKNLLELIQQSQIKDGQIIGDYLEIQEAAFEVATRRISTTNKFAVELPSTIEVDGNECQALVFMDNNDGIYLYPDFYSAIDMAEDEGWFDTTTSILNQNLFENIISDNMTYVEEENNRSVEEYHLDDFDDNPEGWDVVFPNCPSFYELSEEDRAYRRIILQEALRNY